MSKFRVIARHLLPMIAALLLVGCSGPVPRLTTEQKLQDFDFLFETFRGNHPFLSLKARTDQYDWLAHEEEFRNEIRQTRNNREFAQAIRRIVTLVGNGHTRTVNWSFLSLVTGLGGPWSEAAAQTSSEIADYWARLGVSSAGKAIVLAYYNAGEYYYLCNTSIHGLSPGARLTAVDGEPVHEYVFSLREACQLRWDPLRERLYVWQFLTFDQGKQGVKLTAENPTGEVVTVEVRGQPYKGLIFFSLLRYTSGNVYTKTLADGQVGYVCIRSMRLDPADKAALHNYFVQVKDLPALIIDVRGNGGGSDLFWREYIVGQLAAAPVTATIGVTCRSGELAVSHMSLGGELPWLSAEELISRYPLAAENLPPEVLTSDFRGVAVVDMTVSPQPDSVCYQGKIFLLVDNGVYSATESFAAFTKASGWATLVGGCTGGDGIGMTPAVVVLPNSGMAVSFPVTMGLNPDWTANEETHTNPHVLVEESEEDLLKWFDRIWRNQLHQEPDPEIDTALRECLRLAGGGR